MSHRATTARNQQNADVSDIINVFKKREENNIDMSLFVPLKLDRIPRYDLEEINFFSLIDKVTAIEHALTTAREDIAVAKEDIVALKSHQSIHTSTSNDLPFAAVVALPPLPPNAIGSSCPPQTSAAKHTDVVIVASLQSSVLKSTIDSVAVVLL